MSTLESEVVLNSQFTTYAEIVRIISRQEGDFTIDSDSLRDGDTNACLTREFSLGVSTINSDDSGATLDIVGSSANGAFVANVDISRRSGVVIARPTCIGFDVNVGTCKGCLLYTSPSPRDLSTSRMPSSA